MKTSRLIHDYNSEEERQAAIDENKKAIMRTLEQETPGAHKGVFSHEVGRIHGMQRSGMRAVVSTTWEPLEG